MNRTKTVLLVLVAAGFLLSWLLFSVFPGFFGPANLQVNDSFFRVRHILFGSRPRSPYVVHIDIDDATYQNLSPDTGPTTLITDLVEALSRIGVEAVLLDVIATPSEESQAAALARRVRENGSVYCPIVLAPAGTTGSQVSSGARAALPMPEGMLWGVHASGEIPAARIAFQSARGIEESARGVGSVTCTPDADGKYRKVPLIAKVGGGSVPFISLRLAADYLGVDPADITLSPSAYLTLPGAAYPDGRKKDIRIPVDGECRMIVDFSGPWAASFPHYTATFIRGALEDPALLERLRDEMDGDIAIVADVSSIGKDFGPVPLEDFYPLSGLHANLISSILQNRFLSEIPLPIEIALTCLLAALLWVFAARWHGVSFVALAAACLIVYIVLSFAAFHFLHYQSSVARASLGIIFSGAAVSGYSYLNQERQKAAFRARVERYFSPPILDKIMKNPALLEGCEKKELSILFSDIVKFSTWSANQSPEDIRIMLNDYFGEMAAIVFTYGGTIDKYIGDGMLVFFGDPVEQPDHAERAVTCAVAMQRAVSGLRAQWERTGGMPIQVRIGINTGEVVVGNMGSASRLDYTVIGSHVNLAQRLEGKAPPGQVLLSRRTYDAVREKVPARAAGTIEAKGFDDPVEVFLVIP